MQGEELLTHRLQPEVAEDDRLRLHAESRKTSCSAPWAEDAAAV